LKNIFILGVLLVGVAIGFVPRPSALARFAPKWRA